MVWRRGSYATRGASLSTSAKSPSVPAAAAAAAPAAKAEPEVGEDCGCGEAVSLDQLKVNIKADIDKVGETIRKMKSDGVKDKAALQPHIDELLGLKAKWEAVTGQPYDPPKPGAKPTGALTCGTKHGCHKCESNETSTRPHSTIANVGRARCKCVRTPLRVLKFT